MPGRFSVRFFAVRRLPAVGIPVLKRAGRYGSRPFFVCVGGAPDLSAAMTRPPPPLFFCRSVLPLRPAAPSCRSVLPSRLTAPSCRPVLPLCLAALFCRPVPSCRPFLPLCPAVSSCRPSYCPFLPLCLAALFCRSVLPSRPAVHLTAPSCRSVLPPCSAPRPAALSCCPSYCPVLPPHRPGSAGFGRTAHAVSSPFPRSGENPPAVKLRFCMT